MLWFIFFLMLPQPHQYTSYDTLFPYTKLCRSLFLARLPFYIFGRAYDFLLIEAGALFGAMGALFYGRFGAGGMRRHWFPFLYMAFLIPPPGWAVTYLTAPLKTLLSAIDRKSTRLNSRHYCAPRLPSSAFNNKSI